MSIDYKGTQALDVVQALSALIPVYQQWSAARIPDHGLSPARMRILVFLRENGSTPMRALKDWCGTSATNITGLIDGLEAEGLVSRAMNPHDRRVTLITLTMEGDRRSQTEWATYEAECAATFDRLSPETRERFVQTLNELRHVLTS